jgi:aryl-alcohol dehydrogenase
MRIAAAVVRGTDRTFSLEQVDIEQPRAHEVLVRIVATGMCHTDLVVRDGGLPPAPPVVLGHEGAGVVERVGDGVTKVRPGDHVVLTFASCGRCSSCLRGKGGYCADVMAHNFRGARPDGTSPLSQDGSVIHGVFFSQSSFATQAIATEGNIVKVPADLPLELLGPLGCGVQTGAGAIINALRPPAGSSLAIFGAGSVGMSALLAARIVGCTTIIAVDVNNDRLRLATELGATHTINPERVDAVEAIRQETGGMGVNYSLEVTGVPHVFRQAVDCLTVLGTCGVVGFAPMGAEVSLDIFTVLLGRFVRGIIEGDSVPDLFIPALLELYRQGQFPFDRLVRYYDFDEINKAAADSEEGITIKAILRMPA